MEDKELVQEVLSGDRSAFRVLVEAYQDRVFNACLNVLHDREDAEEEEETLCGRPVPLRA